MNLPRVEPDTSGVASSRLEGLGRHLHLAEPVRFHAGQILFSQGQASPAGVFWLESGRVKISLLTTTGNERTLCYFGPGVVFGEESISNAAEWPVTCQAVTEGVAHVFSWPAVTQIVRNEPDLIFGLLHALAEKLRLSLRLVEEMSFLPVKERVARTLARLVEQGVQDFEHDPGGSSGRAPMFSVDLTHQELASLVGASRVMVSNVLAELKKEGVVELGRRQLVVRDPSLLDRSSLDGVSSALGFLLPGGLPARRVLRPLHRRFTSPGNSRRQAAPG